MNDLRFFIICYLLSSSIYLWANKNEEKIKSLHEDRLEIIMYGIDTQISELITKLELEENFDFNKDLLYLLESSSNSRLESSIIKLFKKSEDHSAVNYIFKELRENFNLPDDIQVIFINYIADYQTKEITEYFLTLIDEESSAIAIAAITALGKSEFDNTIGTLIEFLNDSSLDDSRKPAIIESLGKLKAEQALEILSDIATDTYIDNTSLRWKAIVALGEIGKKESLSILRSLFSDADPHLRNYTITALKHYPSNEVKDILIQGLKDSSWRVRVNAAQSLGELYIKDSVPILIYKIKNDPDIRNVRSASLKALGEIGGSQSYDFIRKVYEDKHSNIELRNISIVILVEKDLSNSIKTIKSVFDEEWDKDKSKILDYTCKVLSTTKSSILNDLYSRMLTYDTTINLKLYALRGIKINSISSFKEEVEILTSGDSTNAIRKLAIDVLKEL